MKPALGKARSVPSQGVVVASAVALTLCLGTGATLAPLAWHPAAAAAEQGSGSQVLDPLPPQTRPSGGSAGGASDRPAAASGTGSTGFDPPPPVARAAPETARPQASEVRLEPGSESASAEAVERRPMLAQGAPEELQWQWDTPNRGQLVRPEPPPEPEPVPVEPPVAAPAAPAAQPQVPERVVPVVDTPTPVTPAPVAAPNPPRAVQSAPVTNTAPAPRRVQVPEPENITRTTVPPRGANLAALSPDQSAPLTEVSRGVYRSGNTIIATVGRAVQLDFERAVASVVIGRREIVQEILAEPKRVFLVGSTVGSTNVFIRDAEGRVFATYEMIVEADTDGLRQALAAVLPENRLRVTRTAGGIVLSGQVRSAVDAANAASVASQFVGGEGAVVNSLDVAGDQQVLLRVRVAEMNRTARKFLATDTNFETGKAGQPNFRSYPFYNRSPWEFSNQNVEFRDTSPFVYDSPTGLTQMILGAPAAVTGPTGSLLIGALGLSDVTFSTLEEKGLVRLLAEPALTAISGEMANFLVGGEFPVPVGRDDDGRIIIEFKEFGVKLKFTPVVLSDNQISLKIITEVSRISRENSLILDGLSIPGLSTRRAESTVMLPSGGSLMIAGLLQTEDRNGLEGVPGLMDLPVLGALFRSQDFQNERSELVVTVEAYKVRPRQFGPEMALPTDGFPPADDIDIYLFGRLHDRYGSGEPQPAVTVSTPFGFIME